MGDAMSIADATLHTDRSPVRAVLHLDHLRHNVRVLQQRAGRAQIMGVVKANAYGHGAVQVARVLQEEGIRHLAVARLSEALELRTAGITSSILVLGTPRPSHLAAYATHRLGVTISSRAVAEAVCATATEHAPLHVHVKVDTGMGRIGLPPDEAVPVVRQLQRASGVHLAGLWTHLAAADRPDDPFTRAQLDRLDDIVQHVNDTTLCVHAANSSALLNWEASFRPFDPALVRLGIMLYGLADRPELAARAGLRPVMQLTAQVVHVKTVEPGTSISYGQRWQADSPTRIATIGAGYGDGYFRLLSNRAEVTLQGQRVPVVGSICMDMFMVDIGRAGVGPDVSVGDTAVLFGPDGPSAFEVADWAETIPYEVCCRVAERVPRTYIDGS